MTSFLVFSTSNWLFPFITPKFAETSTMFNRKLSFTVKDPFSQNIRSAPSTDNRAAELQHLIPVIASCRCYFSYFFLAVYFAFRQYVLKMDYNKPFVYSVRLSSCYFANICFFFGSGKFHGLHFPHLVIRCVRDARGTSNGTDFSRWAIVRYKYVPAATCVIVLHIKDHDMASRREQGLSPEEIAALLLDESVSSGDEEEYLDEADASDEEDDVHRFVNEHEPSDDEPEQQDQAETVQRPADLTRSQRKLLEANFRRQDPRPAATYVVRDRRQNVLAVWSTEPQPARRRRDLANILTERSGVCGPARRITTEKDAFKLFITDGMLKKITDRTNHRLEIERGRVREAEVRQREQHLYQPTTEMEIEALLGLFVLRGFYKKLTVKQLFDPVTGPAIFRATMGARRFGMLLNMLTFDDRSTRDERRKGDKFCPLRELFDELNTNLRLHYKPTECITVDESLLRFRGRCSFRMYLPSKPGRYGLLFYTAADANVRYMWKAWPYSGRPQEPDLSPPNTTLDVSGIVHHLVQEVKGSGRNVTCDRLFTSVPLAEELMADRLTLLGTLKSSRRLLPKDLTVAQGRTENSTEFAFQQGMTFVSHCPRRGKLVLALSTQHRAPFVDEVSGKPEIIMAYNATKGGVDVLDAMIESYMGKPPLHRWPTAAFFFMLGVVEINATTILMLNRGQSAADTKSGVRRALIYEMGKQLVMPQVHERTTNPTGLNSKSLDALRCVATRDTEDSREAGGRDLGCSHSRPSGSGDVAASGAAGGSSGTPSGASSTKGRCWACLELLVGTPSYKQQKSQLTKKPPCCKCMRYVCERHSIVTRICKDCQADGNA